MLTIKLTPMRVFGVFQREIIWNDPVITVDGQQYDLSELGDGDRATHPVLISSYRNKDSYTVELRLPHGPKAPQVTKFPNDIITSVDGPITLPPYGD